MYSVNDWRNYTLAHAVASKVGQSASASSSPSGKVAKWDWPGGNNSKAYNEWYYSHNKDKWRQYYLNKKNKNGDSRKAKTARELMLLREADKMNYSNGNSAKYLNGAAYNSALSSVYRRRPDLFDSVRVPYEKASSEQLKMQKIKSGVARATGAADIWGDRAWQFRDPEPQTPSRGESRRRQTR